MESLKSRVYTGNTIVSYLYFQYNIIYKISSFDFAIYKLFSLFTDK